MKRIIFIVILATLFLSGCYGHEDAEYECQISVDSSNSDCSELRGRVRSCQILDMSYQPSEGIASYCTKTCLKKSKFLDSVPLECVKVSVAYSSFSGRSGIILSKQLGGTVENGEKVIEEEEEKVVAEPTIKKECELNSDCKATCEGTNIARQYCDINTYKCKFDKNVNCALESEKWEDYTFTKTCKNAVCVVDPNQVKIKRDEAKDTLQGYLDANGQVSVLYQKFQRECEIAVSLSLTSLTKNALDGLTAIGGVVKFLSDVTGQIIEEGINMAFESDTKMSNSEYVIWSCGARDKLSSELNILPPKIDDARADLKKIDAKYKEVIS